MAVKKLGALLVTKNIITQAQLDEAWAQQAATLKPLAEIIAAAGFAEEEAAVRGLGEEAGIACLDLDNYSLEPGISKSLPQEFAAKYSALPLFRSASSVTVAMSDPLDASAVAELRKFLKAPVRPVFAAPSKIKKLIEREYGKPGLTGKNVDAQGRGGFETRPYAEGGSFDASDAPETDSIKVASLAPVVRIVDDLINQAVGAGASDIHLEPEEKHFYCRFRVDGVLRDIPVLPKKYEAGIISRVKIMAGMDIAEKRLPQDGRIQATVNNKVIDLRISTFPTIHGENVVLRILDRSRSLIRMDQLGMDPQSLKVFESVIRKPHGIILVTGPTGSGKTTTLYAILSTVNDLGKNIVTMEDPVEYQIDRVRQSQVNVKAGVTFAAGLRSILRQDPDIIMIGEIRDYETAEIAIHAALTGHLVFTTLHTNDAVSATTRLIDMGVEPFLVSSSLICAVAQRLVRILCPECKEPYQPEPGVLEQLKITPSAGLKFFREKGCPVCRSTGYAGRIGIYEVFMPDDGLKRLIDKKVTAQEIRNAAIAKGMKTLRDDAVTKLCAGMTSLAEILRATTES